MDVCRTYQITTSKGDKICLGAVSAKQVERFFLAMRPKERVALIEELPQLPQNKEPWFALFH